MGRPRKKKKVSRSSSPRARLPGKSSKSSKSGGTRAAVRKGVSRSTGANKARTGKGAKQQRLQKVLAAAGFGSRRACEQFIVEGRVEVDGQVVTELGTTVDPEKQKIRLDGDIVGRFQPVYYLVNKPPGVLSTNRDPSGRLRVIDFVPEGTSLFTVGRLDKASEGLMLVTNDGDLANQLAHPRYGVEKVYQVLVAGAPSSEALKTLRRGVHLAEGVMRVARLSVKKKRKSTTQLEMVLTEGRNREIRRMAAHIGHKVLGLKRIGFGPLRLGTLPVGAHRPLTGAELKRLQALCSGSTKPGTGARSKMAGRKPADKTTNRRAGSKRATGTSGAGSARGAAKSGRTAGETPVAKKSRRGKTATSAKGGTSTQRTGRVRRKKMASKKKSKRSTSR